MSGEKVSTDGFGRAEGKKQGGTGSGKVGPIRGLALSPGKEEDGSLPGGATGEQVVPEKRGMEVTVADSGEATGFEKDTPKGRDTTGVKGEERRDLKKSPSGTLESKKMEGGKSAKRVSPEKKKASAKDDAKTKPIDSATGATSVPKGVVGTKEKTASATTGGKLVGSDAITKAKANGIATKIPWEEEGPKAALGATSTIIAGKGSGKLSPSKESTPSPSSVATSQVASNITPTASESKSLTSEIKKPSAKPKETVPKGEGIDKLTESLKEDVKKSSKPAEETKSTPPRPEKKETSPTQKGTVSRSAADDSRKWEKGKVESPILGEPKTKSGSSRDKAAGKLVTPSKSPTLRQDTKNLGSSTSGDSTGTGMAVLSSSSQEKSQATGKTGPSGLAEQKTTSIEKSKEVTDKESTDVSAKSDTSKKNSPKTSSKTPSPQSSVKGSSLKDNPKKTPPPESTKKVSPQGTAEKLSPQSTVQKRSSQDIPKKTLSLDTTKNDPPPEKSKTSPSQDSSKMTRTQDDRKKTVSPDERKKTSPQDTPKASLHHDSSKRSPTQDTNKKKSTATSPGASSNKPSQPSKDLSAETTLPGSSKGKVSPEAVTKKMTKDPTEKTSKADISTDKSSKVGYELKDTRIKRSPSSTKVPMSEVTATTAKGSTATDLSKSMQDSSAGVVVQSSLKTGPPQVKKSPSNTSVSKVDKVDLTTEECQEKGKAIVLPLQKSDNVDAAPKGAKVESPESQVVQVQKDVNVKAGQPTPSPSQDPPNRKVDSLLSKDMDTIAKGTASGKKLDTSMVAAEAKVNTAPSEKKLPKEEKMESHKSVEKKTTSPKKDTTELAHIQPPKPPVVEQKDKKATTSISQDAPLQASNGTKPKSSTTDKKKTIPISGKAETSKNGQEKRPAKSSPPPTNTDQHKPISPKSSVNGRTMVEQPIKVDAKESKGKDVQVVVTPTEHKTIVQKLQEARQEAILVRGTPDMRQHSKSEMILPAVSHAIPVPSDTDKHVTSSPNIKVQTPTSQKALGVKIGPIPKVGKPSVDFKEISKSEAILPAVAVLDRSKASEPEKQITSSPNLSATHGRSAEGLPKSDSMARSSPSVAAVNGLHRALSKTSAERVDSRKGSIISDTMASPDSGGQAGARARSATWSQAVAPQASFSQKDSGYPSAVPASATIADPEWDKRWSSAGSDILHEATNGRKHQSKKSIGPVVHPSIGTGKEWRSEGLAKGTGSNGVAPIGEKNPWGESPWRSEIGDRRGVGCVGPTEGVLKGLESELGMKVHGPKSHGFAKFDFQGAADTRPLISTADGRISWDRKDLVSPSSSTASKGSGIEKNSEASVSSYHSAASSTHVSGRRNSRSESFSTATGSSVAPQKEPSAVQMHMVVVEVEDKQQQQTTDDGGDRVKLIDEINKGEGSRESESGATEVECLVTVERKAGSRGGGRGGSGKKRGARGGHGGGGGVENRGADLERALQEEEEAAAAARGDSGGQRPLAELWENDDKFSVANSQLPLTPAGEEDRGSIGSMLTAEPERGNWTGRFDFLLSLLGYSVGLGNVWRFPYLCYNNGGGAFLIPFTIMLIIAGLPLMFMELSFGQYANLGPAAIYAKFCPLFHGLGYGMVIVSTIVMLYYNVIIAWTIFYMFASFNKQLPWQNCEAEWSTKDCFSYEIADDCMYRNGTYYQRTCYNETEAALYNITHLAEIAEKRPPAEEYFNNYVLGLSKGIEEPGEIRLSMALCLLFAWIIVFLCLSKGVQSSGKVVYFTALFPYVVLIILFIRGVTLPGASTGILFYLTPDWKRLSNAQVWGDAAVQIFFALSPAWGGLITLASYNKFSNNCYKDSLIVAVSNILTSFFAGFVIFSVIGFLAHELNVEVKKVVDQGAGLAFIVYPEVVTRLPVSPLWSLLFFVMLLTLGLDSQFALMETVTTAILDRFPNLREKKVWVVLVVAVLGYFGGLIFTTNSGMYWLQLMDKYAANWSVLLIAISECILIAWVYGADRFLRDVQEMIGPQSRLWMFFWCWMWKLVTPAALLFILFFNWVEYAPASYGEYIYPLWADAAGWVIGVFPVLVIVVVGIVKVCRAPPAPLKEKFKRLLQPTPDWGPSIKRSSAPPTYDSIRNTIVLMNGLPVIQETHADGESQEDNTL